MTIIILMLDLADTTPLGSLPRVQIQRKVLQGVLVRDRCARIGLGEVETVGVRVGVMVDLFVNKVRHVESAMHEIGTKVLGGIVGSELEPEGAELFEGSTGLVGEIADDGFGGGVVASPVSVPIGELTVPIWVIASQKRIPLLTLHSPHKRKPPK